MTDTQECNHETSPDGSLLFIEEEDDIEIHECVVCGYLYYFTP